MGKVRLMLMPSVALLLCASQTPQEHPVYRTPQQAVMDAAASPRGVRGLFELTVRASGRVDALYLNSETDYRDPRNLSIVITPAVETQLKRRLGGDIEDVLRGRRIVVRGVARKTRIDFIARGRRTGKYYYQTHLRLADASDLTLRPQS